ncbi:hypothetical protein H072_1409 [Dactylellina haptotyla CBS 200.50]|uniref:Inheritance of peroxisomes protein 1 n=1 Tax=Dactylellina haptotyla (strain CBS 200.50) TaxID=1284197 RepID=S8AUI4_DACHA|nr:hypothetical protein H072_1409 [Dactylellina haptotyla CBS 200.50]
MANPIHTSASLPRREPSPFALRRASTASVLSTTGSISAQPVRRFSTSSSIYSGGDLSPVEQTSKDDAEVLFQHPARILSFTIQERDLKGKDIASYVHESERTLSEGPMKIYKVKFSAAFLQSGPLLQPLLPRGAGWCMDEARGIFVLRIRKDTYYRLELQGIEENTSKVKALKGVLDSILVFEKSNCPFRSEKQNQVFEEPAPLPVFRRSSSVASRGKSRGPRRFLSVESFTPLVRDENDNGSSSQNTRTIPPPIQVPGAMPVLFKKGVFEEKSKPRVPRLQVPQYSPRSTSPNALRNRSVSPLAREVPQDTFTIPKTGVSKTQESNLAQKDDDGDSTFESPRFMPRTASESLASEASTAVEPISLDSIEFPTIRGRSPERKHLILSPPLTASINNPLCPPPVVVEDTTTSQLDLDIELVFDTAQHITPHQSRPCTPPTTPPLSHYGTDSESDDLTEAGTPEHSYLDIVHTNDTIIKTDPTMEELGVVIQDNDPDSLDMDICIIPRTSNMPIPKGPDQADGIQYSPSSRRFIRSTDHQAARGIFGKAVNVAVHEPSGFLLRFMLRVANKVIKSVKLYVHYWGAWRNNNVQYKGTVGRRGISDGAASDEDSGNISDEDDFGIKIIGRKKVLSRRD